MTPVGAEPERSSGEPAAQPPAAALEPGEPHPATSAGTGARGRPVGQGGGEVGQPARVRLLAVLRPPRRPDILRLVPRAAQAPRRPSDRFGELVPGDAVTALGGPLLQVRADQGESPVVGEPLRAAVRPERLGLGVGRVQREQESPDHPTHARSDHRQNPPTAPPAPANRRPPGSPPRAGRPGGTTRNETKTRIPSNSSRPSTDGHRAQSDGSRFDHGQRPAVEGPGQQRGIAAVCSTRRSRRWQDRSPSTRKPRRVLWTVRRGPVGPG